MSVVSPGPDYCDKPTSRTGGIPKGCPGFNCGDEQTFYPLEDLATCVKGSTDGMNYTLKMPFVSSSKEDVTVKVRGVVSCLEEPFVRCGGTCARTNFESDPCCDWEYNIKVDAAAETVTVRRLNFSSESWGGHTRLSFRCKIAAKDESELPHYATAEWFEGKKKEACNICDYFGENCRPACGNRECKYTLEFLKVVDKSWHEQVTCVDQTHAVQDGTVEGSSNNESSNNESSNNESSNNESSNNESSNNESSNNESSNNESSNDKTDDFPPMVLELIFGFLAFIVLLSVVCSLRWSWKQRKKTSRKAEIKQVKAEQQKKDNKGRMETLKEEPKGAAVAVPVGATPVKGDTKGGQTAVAEAKVIEFI
eukprot:g2173.t1